MDSKPEASAAPRRVIKRYSNRKLYDTKDSRYVTLLQIADMVREGEEVQIIDNNSKEDLTEVTLAQIVYEQQKQEQKGKGDPSTRGRNVPLQTLKDLIHTRTEKVLSDLREGPIGRLIPGAKEGAEAVPEPPPPPPLPSKPSLVDQAKGTLEDWQHKIDERVRQVVPSLLPWQQLQQDVRRLEARVQELEAKLAETAEKSSNGRGS